MKKSLLFLSFALIIISSASSQSIQDARKLSENEQYEEATEMYKQLLSKTPSDAKIYYYYGENLLLSDNADSARIIFEKGKAIDGNNPLIKIGLAKLLLDAIDLRDAKSSSSKDGGNKELSNRVEEAQSNVNTANMLISEATANSNDISVLMEAAEAYIHFKNKDTEKAKLLLDKANSVDPKNIDLNLLFGDLYAELNNGTLSADYYNRALDLDKTSARAIVSKGRLYKRSTNYEGAAREFENALEIDSTYAPAHRELAEVYIKLGKLSKAKEESRKYLELSKNNCGARIRYASLLYLSKSYPEAITELEQAKQRCDSGNILMLRVLSYCYYENQDTMKALNTAERLFALLSPEKRIAKDLEFYGKILIMNRQDSAGIEYLQKAFALDPSRTDLLSDIAGAWFKLKQYPNAIQVFNQKIAIGKEVSVLDYYYLSRSYYYNNQLAEADSISKKTNELSPKWASGWFLRAQINAHIDSTSEAGLAKPFYEKYIEIALSDSLNPANLAKFSNGLVESYGYLAYYYILQKDNSNALMYLKRKLALPLDPEDKAKVQQGIDQLEGRAPKPRQ